MPENLLEAHSGSFDSEDTKHEGLDEVQNDVDHHDQEVDPSVLEGTESEGVDRPLSYEPTARNFGANRENERDD
jgi:hypothetical protein